VPPAYAGSMNSPGLQALAETPSGLTMHCVETREDWTRVGTLVGDTQPHEETAGRNPPGATFLLMRNGRPVGTVSVNLASAAFDVQLPATAAFAQELSALGNGRTIVETSLLALDPSSSIDPRVAVLHLLKGPVLLCAMTNADWLLAAVRETEIGFYRRMLNMEILSGAESYGEPNAEPRVLMGLQYREQAPLLFGRIPVLAVTSDDVREYAATGFVRFARPAHSQQAA
jgi:hypothetical protein